jgi:hypothetical protein
MNRVAIYGGLGNQMFQYAFCAALNNKGRKTRILFSNYFYYNHHDGFNLCTAFKIRLPFPLNLFNFLLLKFGFLYRNRFAASILRRLIQQYQRTHYLKYVEKKEFEYDDDVFNQESKLFVGIWQVEDYFKDISDILLNEFAFRIPKDKINRELIESINNCNSVSIHIRRGDYLNREWENILSVIKGTSYFFNSMEYIEQRVIHPRYFIFSDDMKWAKENLNLTNCTYVNHNKGRASYIDMYLMSLCKHNIIANSTFSWWGAWLNKNKDKIVIMPEKWINRDNSPGIFPTDWIKVGV